MNMEITGPLAALMAGIVTSLHCVGMCGPLACSACPGPRRLPGWIYQSTRVASYTIVGAVAGLVGSRISSALNEGATRWMAWVFIGFFLVVVLGLDKKIRWPSIPVPSFVSGMRGDGCGRAAVLGSLTPALPCAPLYLVVAAAAVTGSPWGGATTMLAFGIGTVPLLAFVQSRLAWARSRFSPAVMDWTRRGLALASIGILVARAWAPAASGCPMCH